MHSALLGCEMVNGIFISPQWGAYADVTVKIGLIKLLHKQYDICEEACVPHVFIPAID